VTVEQVQQAATLLATARIGTAVIRATAAGFAAAVVAAAGVSTAARIFATAAGFAAVVLVLQPAEQAAEDAAAFLAAARSAARIFAAVVWATARFLAATRRLARVAAAAAAEHPVQHASAEALACQADAHQQRSQQVTFHRTTSPFA
jgi:hypothetical protein